MLSVEVDFAPRAGWHTGAAVGRTQEQVATAVAAVRDRFSGTADAAIILGTGLGMLARAMDVEVAIDYAHIPAFPRATVESHSGRLLCGTLAGKRVVAMQGRFHLYEGYTAQQVSFPVRVILVRAHAIRGPAVQ